MTASLAYVAAHRFGHYVRTQFDGDSPESWQTADALYRSARLAILGEQTLDRGPDPVRHYPSVPEADESAPPRSWSEPVPVLCQWCGRKPHWCVCSSTYEDLP